MKRSVLLIALLCVISALAVSCAESPDNPLALYEANTGYYYPGGTIAFPGRLDPTTTSASKSLSVSIVNLSDKSYTLKSPYASISNQVFIPFTAAIITSGANRISTSFVGSDDVALLPGKKFDFTLSLTAVSIYTFGEARATLKVPAYDSSGAETDFAFNVYGLLSC
jgi:hypothetical protein